MSQFSIGDHVIIRYGRQQGQKATVLSSQLANVFKVKVEDGSVLFFSGKGLEKQERPPTVTNR